MYILFQIGGVFSMAAEWFIKRYGKVVKNKKEILNIFLYNILIKDFLLIEQILIQDRVIEILKSLTKLI